MIGQVVQTQISNFLLAMYTALNTASYVALLKSAPAAPFNWLTTLADLDEADFTGYTRFAASTYWVNGNDGERQQGWILLPRCLFSIGGSPPAVGNDIFGFAVVDAATAGNLIIAGSFTTPISMRNALDNLNMVLQIQLGNPPLYLATVNGNPQ